MSAERGMRNAEQEAEPSAPPVPCSAWLPSDMWVRALLAPALVFIACGIDRNYQTDLWHHLARGRVMVEEGRLLDEDRFTFTVHGQPFRDVNWLTQVVFYRLYQAGGLELLQAVNALLLAGAMGLLVLLCRRMSGSMAVAAGVGVFTFIGLWQLFLLIRPQTMSLLLFVSLYTVLETARKHPWLLTLAPVHLALWVNVHGAFPIGLLLIGCYGLAALIESAQERKWAALRDRQLWLLAGCLLASILATLVNPYGIGVYEYVLQTSGLASTRKIDEWLPPGTTTLTGKVWAASLVGLMALLAIPGRRLAVHQILLLAAFLPLACGGVRMIAWWLLVLAPIAAQLLSDRWKPFSVRWTDTPGSPPNLGAALTCFVLVALMGLSLPWFEKWSPLVRFVRSPERVENHLQAVAERLRADAPSGRIFTRFEWGEYLGWELGPDFKVFMDGRIEIIPDPVWGDYSALTAGAANWQELLDHYEVDYLVLDTGPYHGSLRPLVQSRRGTWEQLGEQEGPVLVYRRTFPREKKPDPPGTGLKSRG